MPIMNPKYVVLKKGLTPIVFPARIPHNEIAPNEEIVSAGFCSFNNEKSNVQVSCYGGSVSLGIDGKHERDQALIMSHYL